MRTENKVHVHALIQICRILMHMQRNLVDYFDTIIIKNTTYTVCAAKHPLSSNDVKYSVLITLLTESVSIRVILYHSVENQNQSQQNYFSFNM